LAHRLSAVATGIAALASTACRDGTGPRLDPSCVAAVGASVTGRPVSGPTAMTVAGRGAYTTRYTAELSVRGNTAYTSTWGERAGARGNAILIWDVSTTTPILVDSVLVGPNVTNTGDVAISDDGSLLVVATERAPGHIIIFDLADPRAPRELSRFTTTGGGGVHTAEIGRIGGKLYAVLAANDGALTPSRVVIVDLSVPTAPQQVYAKDLSPGFMHDALIRDGLLFLGLWDQGLAIWDVGGGGRGGSPSNPVQISCIGTVGGSVHNMWWFRDPATAEGRYLFVGEEGPANLFSFTSGDIHVVDIADIEHPREVAVYSVEGAGTHNFWMDEARGVLYAAYYNGGIRALAVRGDLGACTAAQRAPDGRCNLGLMSRELATGLTGGQPVSIWSVQYSGGFVYASDMLNGLWKLDAVAP
jgi:hypothetical protein